MTDKKRILIAEDDLFYKGYMLWFLRNTKYLDFNEAIRLFDERQPHIVISDYRIDGRTGKDLFDYVKANQTGYVPFILVSGKPRTDIPADRFVLKSGEFVTKIKIAVDTLIIEDIVGI